MNHDWMLAASCRAHPNPDLWFPANARTLDAVEAKLICRSCPVKAECDAYRTQTKPHHGIWAGRYHNERPRPSALLAPCGTPAAARRHHRHHEPLDYACRQAETRQFQDRPRPPPAPTKTRQAL